MGITAGIIRRTSQTGSDVKYGTASQEQHVTTVERKDNMRDFRVKKKTELIQTSETKILDFAADEEQYKHTNDESIKEVGS